MSGPARALDREARERGNSVYFPDRVIPMLPEVLSNGLCSINPQVDRLCMACELLLNAEGTPIRSRFFEGVMRSQARLIYEEVAAMLWTATRTCASATPRSCPTCTTSTPCTRSCTRPGRRAGPSTSTPPRPASSSPPDGRIEAIVPMVRNDAHRLIEECMLAANVATARHFERKRMPAHLPHPRGARRRRSSRTCGSSSAELALTLGGGDAPSAEDYAELLASVRERPDRHLIQTVLLRSMQQAMYSAENVGHFGLAFPAYTHFTSPIRRYPDLIVHRIIKHILADGTPQDLDYSQTELQAVAEHCSGTERRADEATRDAESWLKCEYMQDKLGEEFDGTITSVTSFGIFVELDEVYVDGLVHITALHNDYYHFDPIGHRLTGERTGNVYRLGDRLRVQVAVVNLDERKIDFVLVASALMPKSGAKGSGKGAAKPSAKALPAQAPNPVRPSRRPSPPRQEAKGRDAGRRRGPAPGGGVPRRSPDPSRSPRRLAGEGASAGPGRAPSPRPGMTPPQFQSRLRRQPPRLRWQPGQSRSRSRLPAPRPRPRPRPRSSRMPRSRAPVRPGLAAGASPRWPP